MTPLVSIAVGWALVAAGFSAVAVWRVLRARAARRARRAAEPAVLLLRPVDRPTALELENLGAAIDYGGPLEQVVVAPERPAVPPTVGFVRSRPDVPNRKVGHLLAALAARPPRDGEVVLSVDADVRVDGALVAELATAVRAGAALSYAAPEPGIGVGLGARAVRALLVRTHHGFRALDLMSAGAKPVCGKAIGLGPAALEILPALTGVAGEDLELATRLSGRGEAVRLVSTPARTPQGRVSFGAAVARFSRWMQVLRAHRPALAPTVPLLFAPTLPLVALAVAAGAPELWGAVAALAVVRCALAWALRPRREQGEWPPVDWLLAEGLLLVAFLRALPARRLAWRGRTFELRPGGRLVPT